MSSFEKSIWNSLTTPEQEQETCRVCVPMLGQPANSLNRASFGSPGARQGQVLLDSLPEWSRRGLLPAPRTKCLGLTAMSLASRSPSKENGHHVTVVLLRSFLLLPYHHVLHSRSHRCLPAPHVEAWCEQGKKKCGFMVCCRERPAWWGALVKVDIPFKYSAQVGNHPQKSGSS